MDRTFPVVLTNACLIKDERNRVLLIEKGKAKDGSPGYYFPGGHIEENEAIVDSVIREVKEETGLDVKDLRLAGVKDFIRTDGSRYIVFFYTAQSFFGNMQESEEGSLVWMDLDELKARTPFWHMDQNLALIESEEYSELFFDALRDLYPPVLK
jgi:8-oxo-dGTP diphosphatase